MPGRGADTEWSSFAAKGSVQFQNTELAFVYAVIHRVMVEIARRLLVVKRSFSVEGNGQKNRMGIRAQVGDDEDFGCTAYPI